MCTEDLRAASRSSRTTECSSAAPEAGELDSRPADRILTWQSCHSNNTHIDGNSSSIPGACVQPTAKQRAKGLSAPSDGSEAYKREGALLISFSYPPRSTGQLASLLGPKRCRKLNTICAGDLGKSSAGETGSSIISRPSATSKGLQPLAPNGLATGPTSVAAAALVTDTEEQSPAVLDQAADKQSVNQRI